MATSTQYRVAEWLPSDALFLENWLTELIDYVDRTPQSLVPPVQDLKKLIESNNYYRTLFTAMFTEIPNKAPYNQTPTGAPQVRDYEHMLLLINAIMTQAPEFNTTGLVGFPINAILDWPMGTLAGYVAFLDKRVNEKFKAILNYWKSFLQSSDSTYVLNTTSQGWLSDEALKEMCDVAYGNGASFTDIFNCPSPDVQNAFGFQSWDDFFTRTFKEGLRPVAGKDNPDIIVNACESAPFRLERDVLEKTNFWIKGQPYSLRDMLADDIYTSQFIGGTVYQAFLSALSYHRWNSPVSGTVLKAYVIDGSYYSEDYYEGFANPAGPDSAAPNQSQAYLTEVATRALIFIEADNPKIGLMCFMSVGMAEVSSNEITVKQGQRIEKGEQLGMFHFGGSTHCLIFRPEVQLEFDLHDQIPGLNSKNIPVRSKLARVK